MDFPSSSRMKSASIFPSLVTCMLTIQLEKYAHIGSQGQEWQDV